jgi:heterodisulfide reductase subunit C
MFYKLIMRESMAQLLVPMRPELHTKIEKKISELSGENVHLCMQCGTCSAVCPMAESMAMTPRRAMHLLQFGLSEEVLKTNIGNFCASCHTCTVRCPRGIDVAKVFEAVRLLLLRENIDALKLSEIDEETLKTAPQIALVSAFRKLTA